MSTSNKKMKKYPINTKKPFYAIIDYIGTPLITKVKIKEISRLSSISSREVVYVEYKAIDGSLNNYVHAIEFNANSIIICKENLFFAFNKRTNAVTIFAQSPQDILKYYIMFSYVINIGYTSTLPNLDTSYYNALKLSLNLLRKEVKTYYNKIMV